MLTTLLALTLAAAPTADTILVNGKVWTGAGPDAQAIAIHKGRILRVGTNEDIRALAGNGTILHDVKNARVVPGFFDSHVHFLGGGRFLSQVDLKDAKDEAEFGKRLKEFDAKAHKSRWLLGGNWDHDRTFNGSLPTAVIIDKYVPERPVFISRYDGHMAVANTEALKRANITKDTKDPPGGVIERLADGSPSGVLKDNAMTLIDKLIPEPDDAEILEAVQAAMKACAAAGITSVTDMDGSSAVTRVKLFRLLQKLERAGELTVRVDLRWPIGEYRELAKLGVEANFGGDFVRIGGVKGFMDGSLGSSTAKMYEPFDSNKSTTGVFVTEPGAMKNLVRQADAAGLSIGIHAIGDRANGELLTIYKDVASMNGAKDRRFRIEHAQHLRPEDYKRFAEQKVIASMQPYHVIDDGRWAEGRIGAKRCASSYAYRGLLDAGAVLAFGSDWPVAPLSVMEGIDAAVNRRTLDGQHPGGWFPEQKIGVAESLKAYTHGSAFAAFQDKDRGTLEAGKLADFVVFDRDILDGKDIGTTKVSMTVVSGKVVFWTGPKELH